MARRRRLLPRLAVAALGCVLALSVVEIVVRTQVYGREKQTLEDWQTMAEGRATASEGEASLGELIRTSEHAGVIYELIPNISGATYLGCPMATDSRGFRGPEVSKVPAAGTLRVVGLGDSVMFGWGVREEECYVRVLESMLNADSPGRVEVINTAVPGYNTAMEVATLEAKALALQPDLVLLGFVGNDRGLPNLIPAEPADYFTLRRSFLWEALAPLLGGRHRRPSDLIDAPRADADETNFEYDPDRVPRRFRDMVGGAGVRRALERLRWLSDEHGFRVLVVAHNGAPTYLTEACAELGLPLLTHRPVIERYMKSHGISHYVGSELTLSDTDAHPSALQHAMLATAIHDYLRDSDLLR